MRPRTAFAPTVLLASFLFFQIQPVIAKQILPWFGGVATVWTLCFLFFQVVLVAGFGWAEWLGGQTPTRQRVLQVALIIGGLAVLPNVGVIAWKLQGTEDPAPRILGLLMASPGLPCLALASSCLLLPRWSIRPYSGSPARVVALVGAGGILGLCGSPYPALWKPLFVAFAAVVTVLAWVTREVPALPDPGPVTRSNRALCVTLAAIPTALLLVVTIQLSELYAASPLLWIISLAPYLFSLFLTFQSNRTHSRRVLLPLVAMFLAGMGIFPHALVLLVGTFAVCLFYHRELAKLAPSPVTVATGGALGAFLIAVVAPMLVSGPWDLPAVLVLTACSLVWILWQNQKLALVVAVLTLVFSVGVVRRPWSGLHSARVHTRNFFGTLIVSDVPVTDTGAVRTLRQGGTVRGAQFLSEENQKLATGYYTHNSGVGLALDALMPKGPLNVGVLGLGVGTIFSYARPHDRYVVFELNPVLLNIASSQFTFMADTEVARDIRLGDPRISLERQLSPNFDLLVVDAAAAGSVPVHFLTQEAFAHYWKHLKPDGVLAVNVSGRLPLAPLVELTARSEGKEVRLFHRDEDPRSAEFASDWVLVTSSPGLFQTPGLRGRERAIRAIPGLRPFSDESNIYRDLP